MGVPRQKSLAVLAVAFAMAGCGSGSKTSSVTSASTPGSSSSSSRIPREWQSVASCLRRHHSFDGSVTYDAQSIGPGRKGTLRIHDRSGAVIANASRYASHADALRGEQGIGPPGPTVSYFGAVALEVPPGASKVDTAAMEDCFDKAFPSKA